MEKIEAATGVVVVPAFTTAAIYFASKPRRSPIETSLMAFNIAGLVAFSIISIYRSIRPTSDNDGKDDYDPRMEYILTEDDDVRGDGDDGEYTDMIKRYINHCSIPVMCIQQENEEIKYLRYIEQKKPRHMQYEYFQYNGRAVPILSSIDHL